MNAFPRINLTVLLTLLLGLSIVACSSSGGDDDDDNGDQDNTITDDDDDLIPSDGDQDTPSDGDTPTDGDEDGDSDGDEEEAPCECVDQCLRISTGTGTADGVLDFGAVWPGSPSTVTVTMTPIGTSAVRILSIGFEAGTNTDEFELTGLEWFSEGISLAQGQPASFNVVYTPENLVASDSNRLRIIAEQDCSDYVSFPMYPSFKGRCNLELTPTSGTFDTTYVSDESLLDFTITATPQGGDDTRPCHVESLSFDPEGPFSLVPPNRNGCELPVDLSPLSSANNRLVCPVSFKPTVAGDFTGTLTVEGHDYYKVGEGSYDPKQDSSELSGVGVSACMGVTTEPAYSNGTFDIGKVLVNAPLNVTFSVTARNNGSGTLSLTQQPMLSGVSAGEFRFDPNPALAEVPTTLTGETTATFQVIYDPQSAGSHIAKLWVFSDSGEDEEQGCTTTFQLQVLAQAYDECPTGYEPDEQGLYCVEHCDPGEAYCNGANSYLLCGEDGLLPQGQDAVEATITCPDDDQGNAQYCRSDEDGHAFCTVPDCLPSSTQYRFCVNDTTPAICTTDGRVLPQEVCTTIQTCMDPVCIAGSGQCGELPVQGRSCDDSDECTDNDQCNAQGFCVGTAISCDDEDICTTDSCVTGIGCRHAYNNESCNDNNPCTENDRCQEGACLGSDRSSLCDDHNPCTDDHCDDEAASWETACVNENNDANTCTDNNACTENDRCESGSCVSDQQGDDPCDDGNPCTRDYCDAGSGCQYTNIPGPCEDGDPCTEGESCSGGQCLGGVPISCDDNNPCTSESCNPDSGYCEYDNHANDGVACNADGSKCTQSVVPSPSAPYENDSCLNGICVPGPTLDCDDGNECTNDYCGAGQGCYTLNNSEPCDADDNICTVGDHCSSGHCIAGTQPHGCTDGNPCTLDSCNQNLGDPATGCYFPPLSNNTFCDDGDPCFMNDYCYEGSCRPGATARNCFDGNLCTQDLCDANLGDPVSGCYYPANIGAPCDDGNDCTLGDSCNANKVCTAGPTAKDCDDGNVCTTDACQDGYYNPSNPGCKYTNNNGQECDDGNPCTVGDYCSGGGCVAGTTPYDCNDGNPCTTDYCDSNATSDNPCVHTPIAYNPPSTVTFCDDGDPCTSTHGDDGTTCQGEGGSTVCDHCSEGACQSGESVACAMPPAPDNQCYYCDEENSCQRNMRDVGTPCNDFNACTTGDSCQGNLSRTCTGTPIADVQAFCEDNNPCTVESCDPALGCQHTWLADGLDCSIDTDPCTLQHCQSGQCVLKNIRNCDDGELCTTEGCDASHAGANSNGCWYEFNTVPCDDDNPCTENDTCRDGSCFAGDPCNCDDGNVCTTDLCASVSVLPDDTPAEQCIKACAAGRVNNNESCSDGNPCTVNDYCSGGSCHNGETCNCNDGNSCTDEECNPDSGIETSNQQQDCENSCVVTNNTEFCDDGQFCNGSPDQCSGGSCVAHPNQEPDDTLCDDEVAANLDDWCQSGVCEGSNLFLAAGDCPNHNEMVKVPGTDWCIDKYEARLRESDCGGDSLGITSDDYSSYGRDFQDDGSGNTVVVACSQSGRYPSSYMTYYQAKKACENSGKVLCTPEIWSTTCEYGDEDYAYVYGHAYNADSCNSNGDGDDTSKTRTGHRGSCTNPYGSYDQSGNVWEWVNATLGGSNRQKIGGSFNGTEDNTVTHQCRPATPQAQDPMVSDEWTGVRCCLQF